MAIRLHTHLTRDRALRNVTFADVRRALMTATECTMQDNGRLKVTGGSDVDGDELACVCVLANDVLVITAW